MNIVATRVWRSTLVILLLICLAGCAFTPQQKYDRAIKRSEDAKKAGKLADAAFFLRGAAFLKPKDAPTHYKLALAYLDISDVRNAVAELKKSLELDPKMADAQVKLSLIYASSNDKKLVEEAESRTAALVASSPDNVDALQALATAEFRLGKQNEAFAHLQQAIEKAPEEVKSSVALAQMKISRGDISGAETVMKQAAARAPKSAAAAVALGMFYNAEKKIKEAEAEFRRALVLDPKNGPAILDLSRVLIVNGRKAEADQLLTQMAALPGGKYKDIHAQFLLEDRQFDAAAAVFEKLYKEESQDRAIRSKLVEAYEAGGKVPEALKLLNAAIEKNAGDPDALKQRAGIYLQQKRFAEAEKDLSEALSRSATNPELHFLMSAVHRAKGEAFNEKRELLEALRLAPGMVAARLQLADVYMRERDMTAARDILEKAPPQDKASPRMQLAMNAVLAASGNEAEAEKNIEAELAARRAPELLMQKAALAGKQKKFAEARALYEEVLKGAPGSLPALNGVAQTFAAQGQRDAALRAIRDGAEKNPKSPVHQLLLANWLMIVGDRANARIALQHAKELGPSMEQADWALARLDLAEGKLAEARKESEAAVAADPNAVDPRHVLAEIALMQDKKSDAITQYKKIADLSRRDLLALNNLAFLLSENPNQLDEAARYAEDIVRIAPDVAAFQDTLGWIYYLKGKYAEAGPHLEAAVKKEGTPRRKYHLAMDYFKQGKKELGEKIFAEAVQMDPKLPEATEAAQVESQMAR